MKNIKFILLILIFLLSAHSYAYSQINAEQLRKIDPKLGLHNQLSLSLDIDQGNSNDLTILIGGRSDYLDSNFYSFLSIYFRYKEANKNLSTKKGFAHLRYIHFPNNIIAPEIFLQKNFDYGLSLTDRNVIGAGVRLNLITPTNSNDSSFFMDLDIGIGAMFENEVYKDPPLTSNLVRSTNFINAIIRGTDYLTFNFVAYFQPNFKKINDYRILCNSTIDIKITKFLSFNTSLNYRYDNNPRKNFKTYDLTLINGINFNF